MNKEEIKREQNYLKTKLRCREIHKRLQNAKKTQELYCKIIGAKENKLYNVKYKDFAEYGEY